MDNMDIGYEPQASSKGKGDALLQGAIYAGVAISSWAVGRFFGKKKGASEADALHNERLYRAFYKKEKAEDIFTEDELKHFSEICNKNDKDRTKQVAKN